MATTTTPFGDIYRFFLNSISNDYRLKKTFADAPDVAQDMLGTWLLQSIAEFPECRLPLENIVDEANQCFNGVLTITEKVILGDLVTLHWMAYNINNITQMNLSVQDRDFQTHAEERNLSGKVDYHDKLREKIYHRISEYTKKLHPISSWGSGV